MTLPALPLTPNGKLDRKALPEVDAATQNPAALAPRDDYEQMILLIWQRILLIEKIGVTDDFFDLGGHSLLAVRMINEVRKATDRDITLADLFRGATIEQLARILRGALDPVGHLTLTPIQTQGTVSPFFAPVIPGVNALGYLLLARALGPEQPFYKLQGPGARLESRPYTDSEIEALAQDYIRLMRTVQPQGPYFLGGMCEGARIALEMTRILESQQQRVALLVIFDTWVQENTQYRTLWYLNYYFQRIKSLLRSPLFGYWATIRNILRKKVSRLTGHPSYDRHAWYKYYWPGREFVPKQVSTRITVIKFPKQFIYFVRDPTLGWGGRTRGGVDVILVPGKHLRMLREPWVYNIAEALGECLHKARAAQPQFTP